MKTMVGKVADLVEFGFILDRQLSDSLLLNTKLIKGDGRKHLTLRCMIKIDMMKDYDSIEWSLLKSMLQELGFPCKYVSWIKNVLHRFHILFLLM